MAIIPGKWCEDCADRGDDAVPAETEWDAHYQDSGGLFLCERCADRRIDQHERSKAEAFYGGAAPFTLQEHYDAAVRQKRELDK